MTSEDFTTRAQAATPTLYRVSCTVLPSEADREDAVQQALCQAWEKRDTLKDERYFQTWLVRILINACYDIHRQSGRVVYTDKLPEQPLRQEDSEQTIALRDAVDSLEQALRLPVVLYYAEGFGTGEIAQMLGISRSAVKMRLHRARALLRQRLEDAL